MKVAEVILREERLKDLELFRSAQYDSVLPFEVLEVILGNYRECLRGHISFAMLRMA